MQTMFPRMTRMKQSFEVTLDSNQSEFKTEEALLLDYIIYIYIAKVDMPVVFRNLIDILPLK